MPPSTTQKGQPMKKILAVPALCAAFATTAAAQEAAEAAAVEEGENLPSVEVSADFSSRQISRGLPDNREPIVTLAGVVEWMGLSFEVDGLFNLTDVAEEDGFDAGDNTEIDAIVGYGHAFDTESVGEVELGADYTYEYDQGGNDESDHCSYLHASVALNDVLLSPTLTCEWMLDAVHGQYYALTLSHEFELADNLALSLSLTMGLANNKYNKDDLGCNSWGIRETTLLAELAWAPTDILTITPYIAYSDHVNGHFRHFAHYYVDEERKHSVAQLYGGIAVELTF